MSDALIALGRAEMLRFVRECTAWRAPGRPLPVLVLFAPAGGGKTTTLQLVQELTERLHTAYLDVVARGFDSSVQILTELVAQLSLGRRGLSTLRFPRFLLGQLALQLQAPDNSPSPGRQQIRDLLTALKARRIPADIRELVGRAADIGVNAVGAPVPGGSADVLLSAVEVAFSRRRGNGEKWWRSAGRATGASSTGGPSRPPAA